jgi:hypothetical protein
VISHLSSMTSPIFLLERLWIVLLKAVAVTMHLFYQCRALDVLVWSKGNDFEGAGIVWYYSSVITPTSEPDTGFKSFQSNFSLRTAA